MTENTIKGTPRGSKRGQRVGRLHTVGHIISEMGKLYRQARRGEITSSDASRLASILALMRQGLEASELEKQIQELAGKVDGRSGTRVGVVSAENRVSALPALPARQREPA